MPCRAANSIKLKSGKGLIGQKKEIKLNKTRPRNFDNCFCVTFSCYD